VSKHRSNTILLHKINLNIHTATNLGTDIRVLTQNVGVILS